MFPKKINSQNALDGMAKKSIARLHPIIDVPTPKNTLPNKPPILLIEAIHEICSGVRGPSINGVSFEVRIGMAGAIQLSTIPCPKTIMLADKSESQRNEMK